MKQKIFISYRRDDSDAHAGRINDTLKSKFDVFFDVDGGIEYGESFPQAISDGIKKADILLVVMGKNYASYFKERENQKDFVLEELLEGKRLDKKIIPLLVNNALMPSIDDLPKSLAFLHTLNAFDIRTRRFHIDLGELKKVLQKKKIITTSKKEFVKEVIYELDRERLLVLFSQDFTPIDSYLNQIKELLSTKFNQNFYQISVPSYVEDEEEYFTSIAEDCGFLTTTKINGWNREIRNRLKSSFEPMILFVEDIEDGNEELDKRFATSLRNLKNKFNHFHLICVGKKGLANLVHGEGHLSPLNNAKELFFPEDGFILGEDRIVQQFNTLGKNPKLLCKYLEKDELVLFSTWSRNETINQLFWKNLLVKRGKRFVWRGERTKELGREVLGCDGDVV